MHAHAEKLSRLFQQICTTAMEPISRKGSFLQLVHMLWRKTAIIVDLQMYKLQISVRKSATVQESYIMWQSGASDVFQIGL